MKLDVIKLDGKKAGSIDLDEALFGLEPRADILHRVVRWQRARAQAGTHSVLTRAEVSYSTKKIYRQKGTGGARHGDKRAPIFVGGGVVFGPRACDYTKKVSKTTRKLALRRVLGDNIRAGSIKTLESFAIADGKTQSFVTAVAAISTARRILIIADSFDEKTYLAARNVQNVLLMTSAEVNVEHIMLHNDIFVVGNALVTLAKRTA